ncbi:MAG: SUMF1/EgtB/PvdO family nonheme iron enzyme [Alphaproteobacteria bacterium]|nr:SUMF1/EgtB/PvdO family nonheme iron enzyme [Alphaproteobacteria bacterium]
MAVVLWSERSVQSHWVRAEARRALDRGILIPARLDDAELPLPFNDVHTFDLRGWRGEPDDPRLAAFVDVVLARLGLVAPPVKSDEEAERRLRTPNAEAELWRSISTKQPPSRAEYAYYLEHYPDGNFAEIARMRMAELARPAPMKLVAGATAIVVLVGGVFGLITQWPEVAEVVVPAPADGPPSIEGEPMEAEPAAPTDTAGDAEADVADGRALDAARPKDLPDLATFTDTLADGAPCGFCPELLVIPAGTFTMGSPPDEAGRFDDEGPQREVRVARFALGRYEVTFAQYDACVDAGGCAERPNDLGWGRGERPVIYVSWEDAQDYVEWLGEATGAPYRLPSEAEWEYAARAGTTTRFAFGDELSPAEANFGRNIGRTWDVGSGAANDWDLFDMHGNVWEWVEDCWHDNYEGAPRDGSAWLQSHDGDCSRRVVRGGSWNFLPEDLRSADRLRLKRDNRIFTLGFRVARTLTP